VAIVGLNSSDDKKIALQFIAENHATFPNALDTSDAAQRLLHLEYRCTGVPLNYVIGRDGKIVDAWYGYEEGHPRAKAVLKKLGVELP
jgi:peroxiredoxin